MNKKLVTILIILILIGVGASFFVKKAPQSITKQLPVATQAKPTTVPEETMQGTLKSLISSKKPQICTYSNKTGTSSVSGTVNFADGKIKADFSTVAAENTVNGHMIISDGYIYIWTGATSKGMKIAFDPNQPTGTAVNSQLPDLNQSFTYVCKDWAPYMSLFIPPSNINFSLISVPETLSNGSASSSSGTVINESSCSVCDKLPAGTSQTACRNKFHCK